MSIQHDVNIITTGNFNGQNILNIIDNGTKLGFVYYDFIHLIENSEQKILNTKDALSKILYPTHNFREDFGRILLVQHRNVVFHLFFYDLENNKLKFSLANFCNEWKQEFYGSGNAEYGVKYQRFIKTALDLCKDFCIEEIKTEAL